MYTLPYFTENDPGVVLDFIRQHPFAFIAGVDKNNKPVATQIPVFVDQVGDKLFLSGHLMRNTDHHKAFANNTEVLAVFTGPHTYISASWYDNPKQASTWNYISVHAKGNIKFLDGDALMRVLQRTTDHYENNPHSGSNFHDLAPDYINKLINAIVAFEIEVYSLENVFKLSQNRDEKSYHNIMGKLEHQNPDGKFIADEMRKRTDEVFPK